MDHILKFREMHSSFVKNQKIDFIQILDAWEECYIEVLNTGFVNLISEFKKLSEVLENVERSGYDPFSLHGSINSSYSFQKDCFEDEYDKKIEDLVDEKLKDLIARTREKPRVFILEYFVRNISDWKDENTLLAFYFSYLWFTLDRPYRYFYHDTDVLKQACKYLVLARLKDEDNEHRAFFHILGGYLTEDLQRSNIHSSLSLHQNTIAYRDEPVLIKALNNFENTDPWVSYFCARYRSQIRVFDPLNLKIVLKC